MPTFPGGVRRPPRGWPFRFRPAAATAGPHPTWRVLHQRHHHVRAAHDHPRLLGGRDLAQNHVRVERSSTVWWGSTPPTGMPCTKNCSRRNGEAAGPTSRCTRPSGTGREPARRSYGELRRARHAVPVPAMGGGAAKKQIRLPKDDARAAMTQCGRHPFAGRPSRALDRLSTAPSVKECPSPTAPPNQTACRHPAHALQPPQPLRRVVSPYPMRPVQRLIPPSRGHIGVRQPTLLTSKYPYLLLLAVPQFIRITLYAMAPRQRL